MPDATSDLDQRGFVHVRCNDCGNPDVWLRCETCGKSDHFLLTDGVASCDCGADWPRATCLCGAQVPPAGTMAFVPFNEGPMALADLEVDWSRVGLLVAGAAVLVGAGGWFLLT